MHKTRRKWGLTHLPMDKDGLHTRKPGKGGTERQIQHHVYVTEKEPCFPKQPPQQWLYHSCPKFRLPGKWENWRCEKTWFYRKKSCPMGSCGGNRSLENATPYSAWVRQQGHYCYSCLCVEGSHNFSWSFNSKYFKTAVKAIVTISLKIVSHEKNIFKSPLQSSFVCSYVYIYIYLKNLNAYGNIRRQWKWILGSYGDHASRESKTLFF